MSGSDSKAMPSLSKIWLSDVQALLNLVQAGVGDVTVADLEKHGYARSLKIAEFGNKLELVGQGIPISKLFGNVGMDILHKAKLHKHFDTLVNELRFDDIESSLERDQILHANQIKRINNHPNKREKVKEFFSILLTRGPGAYDKFCRILQDITPWLAEALDKSHADKGDMHKTGEMVPMMVNINDGSKRACGILHDSLTYFNKCQVEFRIEKNELVVEVRETEEKIKGETIVQIKENEDGLKQTYSENIKKLKKKLRLDQTFVTKQAVEKEEAVKKRYETQLLRDKATLQKEYDPKYTYAKEHDKGKIAQAYQTAHASLLQEHEMSRDGGIRQIKENQNQQLSVLETQFQNAKDDIDHDYKHGLKIMKDSLANQLDKALEDLQLNYGTVWLKLKSKYQKKIDEQAQEGHAAFARIEAEARNDIYVETGVSKEERTYPFHEATKNAPKISEQVNSYDKEDNVWEQPKGQTGFDKEHNLPTKTEGTKHKHSYKKDDKPVKAENESGYKKLIRKLENEITDMKLQLKIKDEKAIEKLSIQEEHYGEQLSEQEGRMKKALAEQEERLRINYDREIKAMKNKLQQTAVEEMEAFKTKIQQHLEEEIFQIYYT